MFREGQNKGMANSTTISIDPDGLEASNGLSSSTLSWFAIEKISITAEYVFLYVSAMNAVVIPRRAFTTETQRQECIQLLQQFHGSASARDQ
jgi:hypothetical protein